MCVDIYSHTVFPYKTGSKTLDGQLEHEFVIARMQSVLNVVQSGKIRGKTPNYPEMQSPASLDSVLLVERCDR